MTMQELYNTIIEYIENNKVKHNIDYEETIFTLKEELDCIEKEYQELGTINNVLVNEKIDNH